MENTKKINDELNKKLIEGSLEPNLSTIHFTAQTNYMVSSNLSGNTRKSICIGWKR